LFVDEVEITVQAGKGGKGLVNFRREKYVPKGGPDGGNGGRGGNVILVASSQLHTLLDHRYKRSYTATDGSTGGTSLKTGRSGEDTTILLPTGTVVRDAKTREVIVDLLKNGQTHVIARGGLGGRGNAEFKSATHQTPRNSEPGRPGESRILQLELKLIADVGLVGFPNAGKSTLISRISAARPKIADYPFTTLEPNLGIVQHRDYESFTVADIPGLIEGAHEGKGLGIQFLRHIERTRVLVVLIESLSDDYLRDVKILRNELASYSSDLESKPWFPCISKTDVAEDDMLERIEELSANLDMTVLGFSSVSGENLDRLKDAMWSSITVEREKEIALESPTEDDDDSWTP
jgi:GTPase